MHAADYPDCDFIDCDSCRAPFAKGAEPNLFFLDPKGLTGVLTGVCDRCNGIIAGPDFAASYARTYAAAQFLNSGQRRNRTQVMVR